MRLIRPLCLGLVFCGCAVSASAPSFTAAPVPELREDRSIPYVYRENAEPTAWPAYLEIDGREAAALQQQGFTWLYLRPGQHRLVYRWPFLAGMPTVKFTHHFDGGKTYAFEMKGKSRFIIQESAIQEVDWRVARERLLACCRYVPPHETFVDSLTSRSIGPSTSPPLTAHVRQAGYAQLG